MQSWPWSRDGDAGRTTKSGIVKGMERIRIPKDFFSPEFDRAVEEVADRLLNREWEDYLALVRV